MTLTEYVMQVLPPPQVAAGAVRAVGNGAAAFVGGFVGLYMWGVDVGEAARGAVFAAATAGGWRTFVEGGYDYMRARAGNVKPWDVAPLPPAGE